VDADKVQMPQGLLDEVTRCEQLLTAGHLTPMEAARIRLAVAEAKRKLTDLRRAQVRVVQSYHKLSRIK